MGKTIYFLGELEKGRDLKVMFISHNAYWSDLRKFANRYSNFKIETHGECGLYHCKQNLDNYDIVFYYGSGFYNENDLLDLEQRISTISNKENKRVSIGYSYLIPEDKRKVESISEEIRIISFKDNVRYENCIQFDRYDSSPLILISELLRNVDEFDRQKVKKI